MENTSTEKIINILQSQREFFKSGATLDLAFRKKMLQKLLDTMEKWESCLAEALWTDLHKSYEEAYLTEISIVTGEIKTHLKKVGQWASKRRVCTPIKLFPSSTHIVKEPLGCSLIVSPWNYPIQLLLNPLVGAISAGCTAVLKPSPYVPTVSSVIEEMIKETFDESYIAVVQGNRQVNTALLEQRWDLIFFTGSPALAKTVMAAAAKKTSKPERKEKIKPNFYSEVELSLKNEIGRKVNIKPTGKGKGTLTIEFYNDKELAEFAKKLAGE